MGLHQRAMENLRFIRETMERTGSFTAVPGWGGVLVGLSALAAAVAASYRATPGGWLAIWFAEGMLAMAIAALAMKHKAEKAGETLLSAPARKFALSFAPPLLAGALLTFILVEAGQPAIIPGMWLLLYGCAVLSASTVTAPGIARLIGAMGALFVALGSLTFALPQTAHTAMLGLGFGAVHVIFGILIGRSSHDRSRHAP